MYPLLLSTLLITNAYSSGDFIKSGTAVIKEKTFQSKEIRVLDYSCVTNFMKFSRVSRLIPAPKMPYTQEELDEIEKTGKEPENLYIGIETETTNVPVAITHSVVYGIKKPLFVLHCSEVLTNNLSKDWHNQEWKTYVPWTWIESVTN